MEVTEDTLSICEDQKFFSSKVLTLHIKKVFQKFFILNFNGNVHQAILCHSMIEFNMLQGIDKVVFSS